MSLFHVHKWTRWSEPVEVEMVQMKTGREYIEHMQRRQCEKCGEIQERTL